MRWWCSAQNLPWSWTWHPYLGVWLLVLVVGVAYRRAYRATRSAQREEERALHRWRLASVLAGLGCLWLLLDWPIGPLGAGYFASVHMAQFLGLAFVVPSLLLFGLPAGWEAGRGPGAERVLFQLTRPLTALIAFDVMVWVTHLPAVVDRLMVTQAGSLVFDLTWLSGGLAFWWCVVRARPHGLSAGTRLAYVLAGTAGHLGLGWFLVVVPYPLYRIFELAPPIGRYDPLTDQGYAGSLMLFGDVLVGLTAAAVLVYRWQREERRQLARAGQPARRGRT